MSELTKEEDLYFRIFKNATEKLMASIELYVSGISYSSSYFLAIIAQEEAAKLIILPLFIEAGGVEKILNTKRKSPYFNHRFKQKIFASYGFQGRSHEVIENLKQSLLYIGSEDDLTPKFNEMSQQDCYKEIKIAMQFLIVQILFGIQQDTKKYSKVYKELTLNISFALREISMQKLPQLKTDMLVESNKIAAEMKSKKDNDQKEQSLRQFFSQPFNLIELCKILFRDDYKKHLNIIKEMSFDEAMRYICTNA
jgi:AbiV family abortive infection protein